MYPHRLIKIVVVNKSSDINKKFTDLANEIVHKLMKVTTLAMKIRNQKLFWRKKNTRFIEGKNKTLGLPSICTTYEGF